MTSKVRKKQRDWAEKTYTHSIHALMHTDLDRHTARGTGTREMQRDIEGHRQRKTEKNHRRIGR